MAELASVEQALEALLRNVERLDNEWIDCRDADGRVLASDISARLDVPPADNSAMDGYALASADSGKTLRISQRIPAGQAPAPLEPGTCARIFTGSEIPPGADCVAIQENVSVDGEQAAIPPTEPHQNVRQRGLDVSVGARLLERGTKLGAASLGLLAGQGIAQVEVVRRPRVAVLLTGDEIIEPGTALKRGQIYNSNGPMLTALIARFGGLVVEQVRVADDFSNTVERLRGAAAAADVIVTTGGVSVGEEDHVKPALEQLGTLSLWRLAMRPGKPLALGTIGQASVVGLPGNPVSSYVGAWLYLRPLLGRLQGCAAMAALPQLEATANFATRTQARRHYMRVTLTFADGRILADAYPEQSSAVLTSCATTNALAVVPPDSVIEPGDPVSCLWLQA
ncbi:molybdopterin molybdotransferase MoeA [Salinicola rhizosphaerae]|uniref:Molybdopterin molybdenumtransferase n=1 Tax=Salinicola rhizosphaerae TaxID=1443141 RepID=A0ABQ3DS70_9GAMM|nr:gephyrin-like molybdotransferase Glp [Salinicola rhizosphaerae]GHB09015.1 molybdopterin molybdenumtransferase MoeA [Salinicola rhizosphaerae]